MKKMQKRILSGILTAAIVLTGSGFTEMHSAAAKVKLNRTKLTLQIGKTAKLKVKNTKKKVKWSSNKKKIATVSKKGVVKAKKKGTAKITAKVGKKKYICTVKVQPKQKSKVTPNAKVKPTPKKTPTATKAPSGVVTKKPGDTSNPTKAPNSNVDPTDPVTPPVTQTPGNITPSPGNTTPSPTDPINPSDPTGQPGQNVEIPENSDVFQIGTKKLALGLTADQVNTVLGSLSVDSKRTGTSPQGFDTIAYHTKDYKECIIVYLKEAKVVGICSIAGTMSYGSLVSAKAAAGSLTSANGWKAATWFNAKTAGGGTAGTGAYQITSNGATVLAYVDYHGDNTVYCIQAFASGYSFDTMTKPSSDNTYNDAILTEMKQEIGELLNAYLVFYGLRTFYINSKVAVSAQGYSNTLASNKVSAPSSRSDADVVTALDAAGAYSDNWGEGVLYGSSDAIGFMNSMIESAKIRPNLVNTLYEYMGFGTAACTSSTGYTTYLVIDYCDVISRPSINSED